MLPGVLYLLLESEELLSALFLHCFSRQWVPTGELWSWAGSWPKQEVRQSWALSGQSNPGSAPQHTVTTLTVSLTTHSNQAVSPSFTNKSKLSLVNIPGRTIRLVYNSKCCQVSITEHQIRGITLLPAHVQAKSVCSLKCGRQVSTLLLCRLLSSFSHGDFPILIVSSESDDIELQSIWWFPYDILLKMK